MLARLSRSRSRTSETKTLNSQRDLPTTSISFSNDPSHIKSIISLSSESDLINNPATSSMISTMTSKAASTAHALVGLTGASDDADADLATARSSSLSELDEEDVSELLPESIHNRNLSRNSNMYADSEAETERLDKSPHKNSTLSKAADSTDLDADLAPNDDASVAASPILDDLELESGALLAQLKAGGRGSLGKRKRPQAETITPNTEDPEEPVTKRAMTDEIQLDNATEPDNDKDETLEGESEEELLVEELLEPVALEANGTVDTDTAENEEEPAVPERRPRGGRKGRRKGGKSSLVMAPDTTVDASDTAGADADDIDEEVEEEESVHDEESVKQKVAALALADIHKDFLVFQKRHYVEQLEQVDLELQLLKKPDCNHPEYLAQLKCVDERRDQKILYEDRLLGFNLTNLTTRTVCERQQLHSQYFQEMRQIRDDAIKSCYHELYALQRERWRFGSGERSSLPLYNPKRADQVLRQASYNLEVSLLSGIAKYVGFPAAPDMLPLENEDVGHDLQLMGINTNKINNVPRTQAFANRDPAEEQFLQQTPWANPQHPAHANAAIQNFHTQTATMQFVTPNLQKRHVDIAAINGSASTIELMSNPPSSIPGPHHRYEPAESPASIQRVMKPGFKESDASSSQQREQIHTHINLLSSTSPPSTRHIPEILGPTPQRPIMAAAIGNTTNRFGS